MVDSKGLVFEGRIPLDEDKRPFALGLEDMRSFNFSSKEYYDLESVIRRVKPTILIGTSGTPGAFTEGAIRESFRPINACCERGQPKKSVSRIRYP